jgi:hypothetical protein
MRNFIGRNGFTWFVGVVEDRNDPIKLGRVRVRCFGWHTEDKDQIPTDKLPWAMMLNSINSAQTNNIGKSPTGLIEGTWVVGFFLDGDRAQEPVIMGSIATIPSEEPNKEVGFYDPNEKYPLKDFLDEPDVNRLSRNDEDKPHAVIKSKEDARTKQVPVANEAADKWDEAPYAYDATYPYNHVKETESGHIVEFDDTEGKERIHEYHKSGTFYEVQPDGAKVTRIVANNYVIVVKDNDVNIQGSCNLTIDNNCTTYIKGNWDIQVDGNKTEVVKGNVTESYAQGAGNIHATVVTGLRTVSVTSDVTEIVGGKSTLSIAKNYDVDALRIDLN